MPEHVLTQHHRRSQSDTSPLRWLVVAILLALLAAESTRVAGESHTLKLLFALLNRLHLTRYFPDVGLTNKKLRKVGHVCGYGLLALSATQVFLGLFSQRTWQSAALRSAALGIAFAALVGSLDEWHQSYLPGRTSSAMDVLIDTLGATAFVALYILIGISNRRRPTQTVG